MTSSYSSSYQLLFLLTACPTFHCSPVICEKSPNSNIKAIDKSKFLVPRDLTAGQFIVVVRKRLNLPPEQAIYLSVNGIIPPTAALMSTLFSESNSEDGFLYVEYVGENVFGGISIVVGLVLLTHQLSVFIAQKVIML